MSQPAVSDGAPSPAHKARPYKIVAPKFTEVHNFTAQFMETVAYGQIVLLDGCMFVWVGESLPRLSQLTVALQSRFVSQFGPAKSMQSLSRAH